MRCIVFVIIFAVLCSGCSTLHRAETAKRAQVELIGMSKKALLTCAGVPVRSEKVEDLEFLTYVGGGDSVGYVGGGSRSSDGGGVISLDKMYCEVTFVLRNGVVDKVNYSGRTGGLITKGEQCGFVVENCLSNK